MASNSGISKISLVQFDNNKDYKLTLLENKIDTVLENKIDTVDCEIIDIEEERFLSDLKDLTNKKENTDVNGYIKFDYSNINDDGFIVQGVTEADGKYYISAYKKGEYSRLYVYDEFGDFEGKIILDNKAHVGGISYDKENGILFVSGSDGKVNAYNYVLLNEIFDAFKLDSSNCNDFTFDMNEYNKSKNRYGELKINNSQNIMKNIKDGKVATLYYDDGYLYAATFNGVNKGKMVKLAVKYDQENNEIVYEEIYNISIPNQTQGIALTNYEGKKYLIVSQSIKNCNSNVLLYELNDDGTKTYLGKYYDEIEGFEGVKVNEDGSVVFVSEYYDKSIVTSMDEIIEKVDVNNNDIFSEIGSSIGGLIYDINHK